MGLISDIFPSPEVALELEPQELAGPVLEYFCRSEEEGLRGNLNKRHITLPNELYEYAGQAHFREIARAVTEAVGWLEREGFIAPDHEQGGEWIFITESGRKYRELEDVDKFKAANLLPHETLDPKLDDMVRPAFIRGEYDTAIFNAFREVEIRIRELGGFSSEDYGTQLMRDAFRPNSGKLTDIDQPIAEQEAAAHLYAGAIGFFKNPKSHRYVNIIKDPVEVCQIIIFADLLIKIAERRKPEESS